MARQVPPQLLGVLKTDEKGEKRWITTVWRLPNGQIRHQATRANVVGKNSTTGETLVQQVLVDAQGKEF